MKKRLQELTCNKEALTFCCKARRLPLAHFNKSLILILKDLIKNAKVI